MWLTGRKRRNTKLEGVCELTKKFFHVEVADMLSCGLGYATSCVASNEGAVRAEPDWQKCKICDIRSLFCTGPISIFVVIIYYHLK